MSSDATADMPNNPDDDLARAAALLAVDPHGIGGVWIQNRRTAAVERWLLAAQDLCVQAGPVRRVPLSISDGRLLGGLDLAATLGQGVPVAERGLLAEAHQGVLVIPNVESARALVLAAICGALDTGRTAVERDGLHLRLEARFGVIALNEGAEPCAPALWERLGMVLRFDGVEGAAPIEVTAEDIARARAMLPHIAVPDEIIEGLCAAAFALGAGSVRTPMLALRVARAAAALSGRAGVNAEDAGLAVRLVIAPRATRVPANDEDEQQAQEPPPPSNEKQNEDGKPDTPLDDKALEEMLVAAALAALPSGVLDSLKVVGAPSRRPSAIGRSGAKQKARLHGRRSRSRRGDPRDGAPLDILETIRAAAPWQKMRRAESAAASANEDPNRTQRPVEVRRQDFRVRTFKNHRETATIFVVDASGSSALNRLAEAKGAIELLLADCYSRRDNVALIAFRGKAAELLLPPTRSLARVKKLLAALPGGGGTPLASAARCAGELAEAVRRKGQTPAVVFLTDGKANIDLNGAGSRERGEADAMDAAREFKATGVTALVIDTSPRPAPQSRRFAAEMSAVYLPLPHANAQILSQAVRAEVKPARAG